jgi:hypothetical protein
MSYEEHIAQCKSAALAYLDDGDHVSAITSMLSDLSKHPETREMGKMFSPLGMFAAASGDPDECRRFIEGFR